MGKKANDFQKKVRMEMINTKKILIKEELRSALLAIGFGLNVAAMISMPLGFFTAVFAFGAGYFLSKFKLTVKKQWAYDKHLKFLKDSKSEKVWTPQD